MKMKKLILFGLGAAMFSGPSLAGKYPEMSEDGLGRVESKRVDAVYWKEGVELGRYRQVAIGEVSVEFIKNWQRNQNSTRRSPNNRITNEDMDNIRQALAGDFVDVFTQELEEGGYSVVEGIGPDILKLQPRIVDLDVYAPDLQMRQAGRVTNFTQDAGRMTLNMDVSDSSSEELIGRVIDKRLPRWSQFQMTNRVTNRADARRAIRQWARAVRNALDEAHGIQ
jgi:hypothetical protein